jgi:hypothetical protein
MSIAKEESSLCCRIFCKGIRPFTMALNDPTNIHKIIVLERPFKCTVYCGICKSARRRFPGCGGWVLRKSNIQNESPGSTSGREEPFTVVTRLNVPGTLAPQEVTVKSGDGTYLGKVVMDYGPAACCGSLRYKVSAGGGTGRRPKGG